MQIVFLRPTHHVFSTFDIPSHLEVTVYRHVAGRINDTVILQIASLGILRPLGDILIVHHKGEFRPATYSMETLERLTSVSDHQKIECGATFFQNEGMKEKIEAKFGPDPRIDVFDFGAIAE